MSLLFSAELLERYGTVTAINIGGRGGSNPCNPGCLGLPASSNFYTREIKKILHAGGHDADMGIPITGYP
ncbi:hypothetical protein E0S08_25835 [Salmonella enterica subsp. enterica serovar Onderstepoort]|nr:hypothetical protein [Salmonella enterica subsp. enterica serovar Onderstepoort]